MGRATGDYSELASGALRSDVPLKAKNQTWPELDDV